MLLIFNNFIQLIHLSVSAYKLSSLFDFVSHPPLIHLSISAQEEIIARFKSTQNAIINLNYHSLNKFNIIHI